MKFGAKADNNKRNERAITTTTTRVAAKATITTKTLHKTLSKLEACIAGGAVAEGSQINDAAAIRPLSSIMT